MIIHKFKPWVGQFLIINFILSQDWATCSWSSCLKFIIWFLREIIFAGGKYLVIKASLHLSQESILFCGKYENQIFARSCNENGNNFNFTISVSTSFFFCMSHNSTKVLRWDASSSLGFPANWSYIIRFSNATLISYDSALVAGGAIGVLMKSLLLVFEKSHNLVYSWDIVTIQASKQNNICLCNLSNEKNTVF